MLSQDLFSTLGLGFIEGLTEFIPVSSSGHLLLLPALFGWKSHSLSFDTTLHLGTSLALIVYFFNDYKKIISSFFEDLLGLVKKPTFDIKKISYKEDTVLGFNLLVASVPALILGFLFNDYFENTFRHVGWSVVFIVAGSILMLIAELLYSAKRSNLENFSNEVSYKRSFCIGLFQSLALFPGFSRSGSTISGGMLLGMSKENSARFSFLISIFFNNSKSS